MSITTPVLQAAEVARTISATHNIGAPHPSSKPDRSFADTLGALRATQSAMPTSVQDLNSVMNDFTTKAVQGGAMPLRDLLVYQIRAGEFGMRVELLSKVADSFLHTLRKLQQPQ